jgi:hypothetical protein
MTVELKRRALTANHALVDLLMRGNDLLCLRRSKFVGTTAS